MRTYRGMLLATTSGLVAAAGGAQAADLPLKAAPMIAAANWTGWYIGGHVGAAYTQGNALQDNENPYSSNIDSTVFIGGGQIGYNWQKGNAVFGLEADISGLSDGKTTNLISFATNKGAARRADIQWLATFRGRMGLAVNDTMAYVTGGLAVGGVKNYWNPSGATECPTCGKSDSSTKVGWVIGGGIEHMWNRHWTVALEGLFVDLGSTEVQSGFSGPIGTKTTRFTNQAIIGRFKINYKW